MGIGIPFAMRIQHCPYRLEMRGTNKKGRQGSLLRVIFKDGLIGFTDCHPWPEVGDQPLENQLLSLKAGNPTSLLDCSLRFARLDAEARNSRHSLLTQSTIPDSHFFISDLLNLNEDALQNIIQQGFRYIKAKVGNSLPAEIAQLLKLFANRSGSIGLRLDFNEKIHSREFVAFLNSIEPLWKSIDYIEDPTPYNPEEWTEFQQSYPIALACDRLSAACRFYPRSARYLIIKPAIQPLHLFKDVPKERMIVTSYLGHPLGQLHAAYAAMQFDPQKCRIHGLLGHYVYHPNAFSQALSAQGPAFTVPHGYGFGFDEELSQLSWMDLP